VVVVTSDDDQSLGGRRLADERETTVATQDIGTFWRRARLTSQLAPLGTED